MSETDYRQAIGPDDMLDPLASGYTKADDPYTGANSEPISFQSGGAGLMSTLTDYLALIRMIVNRGSHNGLQLLAPETLELMRTNQCPSGVVVNFPFWDMPSTTFGLGFALKGEPAADEPESAIGEYHWGGMAGTHHWMSPSANLTGICMTQRMPGFWHPFSHDFKRLAYKAAAV